VEDPVEIAAEARSDRDTVAAALGYLALGWPTFLVSPATKKPAAAGWQRWPRPEPDQVALAFACQPEARSAWPRNELEAAEGLAGPVPWSIGLRCGQPARTWVLAVDAGHGGWESIAELEREHGALPMTPAARTPSGGAHIFYRLDGTDVRNRAGVRPGVDVRGTGGFVVLPPAPALTGLREWIHSPAQVELALAPPWLLELVTRPAPPVADPASVEPGERRGGSSPPTVGLLGEGQRNWGIFRYACSLRARGAGDRELAELVHEANRTLCVPPLEAAEIDSVLASALRYQPGEPKRRRHVEGGKLVTRSEVPIPHIPPHGTA